MKNISRFIPALTAGFLIFAGLPMLGWGLSHLPEFFENPARAAYILVILVLQVFSLIYNPQVGQRKENRKSNTPGHKLDLILIQVFSLALVVLAPFSDRRALGVMEIGDPIRFFGLVIAIPGFILMQAGEKHLAKQFSIEVTVQKNHQLIQSGPYQYIRHPRYLGILTFFFGIALTFRSLLGFGILFALGIVLVWRIFAEEKLMKEEFGAEWEAYRAKTWKLIPYLF